MIDIAYCIDENMYYELGVSIASLLTNRNGAHYHIRIVASKNITLPLRKVYDEIMAIDPKSRLEWLERTDFASGVKMPNSRWSMSVFDRLAFPDLFPKLKKIIYMDADTVVMGSLKEAWDVPLGDDLLAAVVDNQNLARIGGARRVGIKGDYFISSFLVMNLELMRVENLSRRWAELAGRAWEYPDQDILNVTCDGRWKRLPLCYNANFVYDGERGTPRGDGIEMLEAGIISADELAQSIEAPIVIHCQGWDKPWKSESHTKYHHYFWWKYAKLTPFYDLLYARYVRDLVRTGGASAMKTTYKLFGVIPFMKRRLVKRGARYLLFGLPILTTKERLWT